MFVLDVVGELELVEGDDLGHPLLAGGRRVRVDVHALGHFRVRFAGHHPARVEELVATVVGRHDVHEQNVLGSFVEAAHFDLERREHASRNRDGGARRF